ncbi:DMT family transporter [Nannocystis pusilla]|uniref:DMT family transporter n=1 Tax=Nannocystis pusilla TaxID=889268 RepID=A0ABS7TIX2_9BACT|nr:DMT family transporter [Nannocystis pusilla]
MAALGYILLCLIWGSTWLAIKLGLDAGMPPLLGASVRFAIAAALLLPAARVLAPAAFRDRTAWRLALMVGLFSFGFGYGCTYVAALWIPSGLGSLTFGFFPFWVAVLAHFILKERLTVPKLLAIAVGFAGLALLSYGSLRELGRDTAFGVAIVTFSVFVQGFPQVVVKRDGKDVPTVFLSGAGMAIGSIVLLLVAGAAGEWSRPFPWNATVTVSVAYLAVMGSIVTFMIYYGLLKRLSATLMALVALITPPIAVVLGSIYRSEQLGALTLTGGALVLVGVGMFQLEERRAARLRRGR